MLSETATDEILKRNGIAPLSCFNSWCGKLSSDIQYIITSTRSSEGIEIGMKLFSEVLLNPNKLPEFSPIFQSLSDEVQKYNSLFRMGMAMDNINVLLNAVFSQFHRETTINWKNHLSDLRWKARERMDKKILSDEWRRKEAKNRRNAELQKQRHAERMKLKQEEDFISAIRIPNRDLNHLFNPCFGWGEFSKETRPIIPHSRRKGDPMHPYSDYDYSEDEKWSRFPLTSYFLP